MSSGSAVTRLVLLLAVLGVVTVPACAATATGQPFQQVSSDETGENTSLLIDLRANGNAQWTVSTTFNLTSPNETAAYRDLAQSFAEDETPALGLPAFRQASDLASESSGRSMEITDVRRTTAPERMVENGTGRLTLSFTWTNFGRVEGDRLTVGDVFRTSEGQWLPGLEDDQTLTIQPPDGFGVVNASVAPDDGTLRWEGPTTFEPTALDAAFTGSDPSGPTAGPNGTESPNDDDQSGALLWGMVALLGIGALAAMGYFMAQRDGFSLPAASDESGSDGETPAEAAASTESAAADDAEEADDADEIDEELLSDEERVERLLERNGGRMKQANIVRETGWSNAKVSQLLSAMQEDGRIDKLRIGRENLISFPDEDITDIEE
jgi:uncharacterized membrane protein